MFNGKYSQANTGSETHFSQGIMGETEFSRMTNSVQHLTTFNAGDIVPIYCAEILPHDTFSIDIDAVIRQSTLMKPTMGQMMVDFYAYFVPNRVVNESTPFVFGENPNSSWTANEVSYVPLLRSDYSGSGILVPVGSVADYYGFPTQVSIPSSVLKVCNDLKFRGYVEIYNQFFRDQNYQPPVPYSKLNVYEAFFENSGDVSLTASGINNTPITPDTPSDGSVGLGAVKQSVFGNFVLGSANGVLPRYNASSSFNALGSPLKANKLHDYFTSVVPSPQKGPEVFIPVTGSLTIPSTRVSTTASNFVTGSQPAMEWRNAQDSPLGNLANFSIVGTNQSTGYVKPVLGNEVTGSGIGTVGFYPANLATFQNTAQVDGLEVSVNDLRLAAAVQKVYEALGRGGSRYRCFVKSFFGIEVDDPFRDIPTYLGHIRRDLNLFQTAQTSASADGSTPQGNLAGFGYTNTGGQLFPPSTFMEHGYLHVFAVVRHKNIYPSLLSRDNFRLNMMDYYTPQMANISEQPVYTREINPFLSSSIVNSQVFGYQEAWAEYRYDPDRVSGLMRPGVSGSLAVWNYADDFSSSLTVADSNFINSNSQTVLDRTLAVTSSLAPQFLGQFVFKIDKQRPMPTYSVPGMDII